MPSQLFAQNLSQGMDAALRIKQMQQQRAIEQERQAFDLMQFEAQKQQQQIANQLRQSELDRLIENDTYRQGVDMLNRFERDQAIRREQQAAQALFSDLLGQKTKSDEMMRMQSGGMGPPAGTESVPADDPRAVQFAHASPFMQELAYKRFIKDVERQEKEISGDTEIGYLYRIVEQSKKDEKEFKDGDPNKAVAQARRLWAQGEIDRRLAGATGNPMAGLADNVLSMRGGPFAKENQDPNNWKNSVGAGVKRTELIGKRRLLDYATQSDDGMWTIPGSDINQPPISTGELEAMKAVLDDQIQQLSFSPIGSTAPGTDPAMGAVPPPARPVNPIPGDVDIDALNEEYEAARQAEEAARR